MYSCLKPIAVRSPEQTTISGSRSLISLIARSIRPGTKWTSPQWMSEMWAILIGARSLEDRFERPVERRRDERRRRDRQHPGEDDVPGHAPADGGEALRRSRTHHRSGDHVGRRDRVAEMGRDVDHRSTGELRREAAGGLEREDPLADRA